MGRREREKGEGKRKGMREEVKGEGRRVRRREAIDEGEKSTESCMNVQTSNAPW